MAERRPMGSLEAEVLAALWAIGEPSNAASVQEALSDDLAYTTVNTILARLHAKGLIERKQVGRAFVYEPNMSEAQLTAQKMADHLYTSGDRKAALSQFVGNLSKRDEKTLRALLEKL